jgi:hypothetical protein
MCMQNKIWSFLALKHVEHTLPWLSELLHIYMTINMMVPLYYNSLWLHVIPQAKIDHVLRHCPFWINGTYHSSFLRIHAVNVESCACSEDNAMTLHTKTYENLLKF